MKKKQKSKGKKKAGRPKEVSELRQDPVSKGWVVIASGRAKRPTAFKEINRPIVHQPRRECPFCNLEKTQFKPNKILLLTKLNKKTKFAHYLKRVGDLQRWKDKIWSVIVVPNKYPSFTSGQTLRGRHLGPFYVLPGRGYHEVIITASHERSFGQLPIDTLEEVIDAYQKRYLDLKKRQFIQYISIIHNHRQEAGASLTHPHSQIFAIPIIPKDVSRSLTGSKRYYHQHHRCVHCDMITFEQKTKKRIIFENENFIVVCPFISTVAFEIRIYPKNHKPYFEKITAKEKKQLAECFHQALGRLYKGLDNPPYNFFFLTAPCKGDWRHYHWHVEILPKITIWAGFELATGVDISSVKPEKAASILSKVKLK